MEDEEGEPKVTKRESKKYGMTTGYVLAAVGVLLGIVMLFFLFIGARAIIGSFAPVQMVQPPTQGSTAPTEAPPVKELPKKESTATIGVTGDILLHKNLIKSGYDAATGTYDYRDIFSFFSDYVSQMDYAVANMEGTLCGDDNGYAYAGYPHFNAPDAIMDAAKEAGFDMMLTANNHSFDTGDKGFFRTQEVIRDRGMDHIGTRYDEESKNYIVKEINGIRIGMICYTYNTGLNAQGNITLNGIHLSAQATKLTNSFNEKDLPSFYEKLRGEMQQMRAEGAEVLMLYIHWGEEYQIKPNSTQKAMAQELCDLGIDVIVGNHPHVAQPIELLSSTLDESKKTLCLYSTGNSLSNIRGVEYPIYTEDGMLFQVTFAKYSDGSVILESADVLPIWVNRYEVNSGFRFQILVMDGEDPQKWQSSMGITDETLSFCKASYDRTMSIIRDGLHTANAYYSGAQAALESTLGILS